MEFWISRKRIRSRGSKRIFRNWSIETLPLRPNPAAPKLPNVELRNFLQGQREHVVMLLGVYILIDPYPEKQIFVQQAFLAFLIALKQLPKDIIFD
jgi:hypothetical protein